MEREMGEGIYKIIQASKVDAFFYYCILDFKLILVKFSAIINYPLSLAGIKIVRLSKLRKLQVFEPPVNNTDIEKDEKFMLLYAKVKNYTIVEIERCYSLYKAVHYILKNNIPGDFVECGVMKGGSMMMVALMLAEANITNRKLYLYDTFAGMPAPGVQDGEIEKEEWRKMQNEDGTNNWCYASFDDVETNMKSTGYPSENLILVRGKVEETIPGTIPDKIALLRLDTDWYSSTKHELVHLFPILEKKGILIIDDYGAWQGARKATDEYFKEKGPVYLNRIDFTGRLIIK